MFPLIHPGCLLLHPAFCIHICPLLFSESGYYRERLSHLNAIPFDFSRGVSGALFYHPLSFRGVRKKQDFPPAAQKSLPRVHCSLQQAKLGGVWEAAVGPTPHCCEVLW